MGMGFKKKEKKEENIAYDIYLFLNIGFAGYHNITYHKYTVCAKCHGPQNNI